MKHLQLKNSEEVTVVDDNMFELCSRIKWRLQLPEGKSKSTKPYIIGWYQGRGWTLQQFLWYQAFGQLSDRENHVDHIDGDTMNNVLSNLRLIPCGVNSARGKTCVQYRPRPGRIKHYEATVYRMIAGKRTTVFDKYFMTEAEARQAVIEYKQEHGLL